MKAIIRQIISYLINLFWTKPVEKPEPWKAVEVNHIYTCIKYGDQWVNLKRTEVQAFHAMARSDKRGMANKFKNQVKKGHIKFIEIDGEMICVNNKNYGSKESGSE